MEQLIKKRKTKIKAMMIFFFFIDTPFFMCETTLFPSEVYNHFDPAGLFSV